MSSTLCCLGRGESFFFSLRFFEGGKNKKTKTKKRSLPHPSLFPFSLFQTSRSIKKRDSDGYKVCDPPSTYVPIMTPARKLSSSAPAPLSGTQEGFFMSDQQAVGGAGSAAAAAVAVGIDLLPSIEGLPELRPEDAQYFGKLLAEVDEDELTLEEAKERRIMKLLLKVKNGTPQQRKSALRTLGDKAREFGAGPLFNQILPLLMSPALDDQERHVLVKVVDRVLRRLDELVRPYVHKVLVVVEPLLIDEDYYARIEGREIVANLAKAAGLATMIAAMRPVSSFFVFVFELFLELFSPFFFSTSASSKPKNPTTTGHRRRRRVRPQHHRPRLRRRRLGPGSPGPAPLPQGRVPLEKVMAGAAHGHQNRAADRDPPGLRRAPAPELAGGRGRGGALRRGRAQGQDDGGARAGRARRGRGPLRHRRVRRRARASLEGRAVAARQGPGSVPQGDRQHHPADGRDLRQLLHARGKRSSLLLFLFFEERERGERNSLEQKKKNRSWSSSSASSRPPTTR